MEIVDKFLIGTIMLLGGTVGITSLKAFWTMVIGAGVGLMIIALAERFFQRGKSN